MDNSTAKGLCMVVLLAVSVVLGLLPMWLHHRRLLTRGTPASTSRAGRLVLDLLSCFAGGVFLGVCLLNLLVEGSAAFDLYKDKVGYHTDFPFYEALAGVGLFLITLMEKLGFALISFFSGGPAAAAARSSRETASAQARGGRGDPREIPSLPVSVATSFDDLVVPHYPLAVTRASTSTRRTVSFSLRKAVPPAPRGLGACGGGMAAWTSETAPLLKGVVKPASSHQAPAHPAVSTTSTSTYGTVSTSRAADLRPLESRLGGSCDEDVTTSETAPLLSSPVEHPTTGSTVKTVQSLRSPVKLPSSDGDNRPQPRSVADMFRKPSLTVGGERRSDDRRDVPLPSLPSSSLPLPSVPSSSVPSSSVPSSSIPSPSVPLPLSKDVNLPSVPRSSVPLPSPSSMPLPSSPYVPLPSSSSIPSPSVPLPLSKDVNLPSVPQSSVPFPSPCSIPLPSSPYVPLPSSSSIPSPSVPLPLSKDVNLPSVPQSSVPFPSPCSIPLPSSPYVPLPSPSSIPLPSSPYVPLPSSSSMPLSSSSSVPLPSALPLPLRAVNEPGSSQSSSSSSSRTSKTLTPEDPLAGCACPGAPGGMVEVGDEHHHHHHSLAASKSCYPQDTSEMSVVRGLLLLGALSFHTVFDGLAIGLQQTKAQIWGLLVGIAVHKGVVSFCLGVDLATTHTAHTDSRAFPRRPVLFMLLFALIAPVGVAIGMGVTSSHLDMLAELLVSSVLQALATGTFLYVTFFEILGQQFAHSHAAGAGGSSLGRDMVKLSVTVTGFACTAGIKVLADRFG